MVNHIKTLLLNRMYSDIEGLDGEFYIDEKFVPLSIPARLGDIIENRLFAGAGIKGRLDIVNSICRMLDRVDFARFVTFYDKRVTPLPDDYKYVQVSVNSIEPSVASRVLFAKTGFDDIDSMLDVLERIGVVSLDGNSTEVSCLLALVAQLEAVRRSRDGG